MRGKGRMAKGGFRGDIWKGLSKRTHSCRERQPRGRGGSP